jgi:hypothetical protein
MKKIVYLIIVFVFLISNVASQEISLRQNNYVDFVIDEENPILCKEYIFNVGEELLSQNKFPIFSLKATFLPKLSDSTKVTLNFNNFGELTLSKNNFYCNNECWARIILAKSKIRSSNTLTICVSKPEENEKTVIFADSKIGFYETPFLTIDHVSPGTIFLGDRAEMKIIAKNIGSKDANVFIQFIDPVGKRVIILDGFFVIEGESTVNTTIKAGETKQFTYFIKPLLESSYNLPSAILTFTNIFGEEESIYSTHPQLYVIKPEKTEVFIAGSNPVNNFFNFKIIVRNKWDAPFKGQLRISHEDHVEGALSEITIPPNSEKEFLFNTNELQIGDYNFFAIVEDENSSSTSNSITFKVTSEKISDEVYFAITGIIVSILIFLGIYFLWKEAHN